MTVSFCALYQAPDDPPDFDDEYFRTHVPLELATMFSTAEPHTPG